MAKKTLVDYYKKSRAKEVAEDLRRRGFRAQVASRPSSFPEGKRYAVYESGKRKKR